MSKTIFVVISNNTTQYTGTDGANAILIANYFAEEHGKSRIEIWEDEKFKCYVEVGGVKKDDYNNFLLVNDKIDDFYREEGMAIYVKGKMRIGIHPDNFENNLKALQNGDMRIDWSQFKVDKQEVEDKDTHKEYGVRNVTVNLDAFPELKDELIDEIIKKLKDMNKRNR